MLTHWCIQNMNVTLFVRSGEHIDAFKTCIFYIFYDHFGLKLQNWVQMNMSWTKNV